MTRKKILEWLFHYRVRLILIFISVLGVWISYLYLMLNQNWAEWTGFNSKTLWDWMELLIVPAFLILGAKLLGDQRKNTEIDIEADRTRGAALQTYLDHMTELLLERDLRTSDKDEVLREIARARTLTVLSTLDGIRKGLLIRFLKQSKLISRDNPIIDLSGANLTGADLSGTDISDNRDRKFLSYLSLNNVQLAGANLRRANFAEAKLSQANLFLVDLTKADLRDANLMFADLRLATLTGAKFNNANLLGANLSGAKGTTGKQLAQAKSLKGATMPDGNQVD